MAIPLPEWLINADLAAWYKLHATWRAEVLDALMPFVRNPFLWAPVYLFLAIYMPVNYGKKGLIWCAGFLLCFAFGDFISAHLLKPLFERARPCNDPALAKALHLIVERSSGLSFPSSHATNHFALGTFMAATIGRRHHWIIFAALFWALLICYAQVYVGVHFPMDVAAGGLLGAVIGGMLAFIYNRIRIAETW